MEDIKQLISSLGIDIDKDKLSSLETELRKNYKSISELKKYKEKNEMLENQLKEATQTITGFKEMDIENIQEQAKQWKEKAEKAEKEFNDKLHALEYKNALESKFRDIKFTSNSAKELTFKKALESNLKLQDGNILGFDDFIKMQKDSDPHAFDDSTEPVAKFTTQMQSTMPTPTLDKLLRSSFGLPDEQ